MDSSMLNITSATIDQLYASCLTHLFERGEETHPRGFNCLEISPCSVTLTNPQANILTNPVRKASLTFMAAEFLWILMGRSDVEMISFYNSKISSYSDDGVKFFGAYGPKITSQLEYVVNSLQQDPWTRQALLTIWRECPPKTKDIPCTVALHFIRRPIDALNLVVYMRSQDVWLGFPYDVHNFTSLQSIVASMLNIKLGVFTLIQGSLHMYEENRAAAKEAMKYQNSLTKLVTPLAKFRKLDLECIEKAEKGARTNSSQWSPNPECPLLMQKLIWLRDFARRKHETARH